MTDAAALLPPSHLFCYGLLGGLLPEFYYLYKKRKNPRLPAYIKRTFYWVMTFLMAALGGGVAWLYGQYIQVNIYLAIHLGVVTPVLLNQMIASDPKAD